MLCLLRLRASYSDLSPIGPDPRRRRRRWARRLVRVVLPALAALILCLLALTACSDERGPRGVAPVVSAAPTPASTPAIGPVVSAVPLPAPAPAPTPQLEAGVVLASALDGTLEEVDARTGALRQSHRLDPGLSSVTVSGDLVLVGSLEQQELVVVDRLANAVATRLDLTALPLTGTPLLSAFDPFLAPAVRPVDVAVVPGKDKAYVATLANLTAIDLSLLRAERAVLPFVQTPSVSQAWTMASASPLGGLGLTHVAASPDVAVASCALTNNVLRLDVATDAVLDFVDVGLLPAGIAVAGGKAYVACALSQEVWILDVQSGAVRGVLDSGGILPWSVAASADGQWIYVGHVLTGDVTPIEVASDRALAAIPAGPSLVTQLQGLGVAVPSAGGAGWQTLLAGFLQGYLQGLTNPGSLGNLVAGGQASALGLLSPAALLDGLIAALLSQFGVSASQLQGASFPGLLELAPTEDPGILATSSLLGGLEAADLSWSASGPSSVGLPTLSARRALQASGGGPAAIAPVR